MSNQVYENNKAINPKFANQRLDALEAGFLALQETIAEIGDKDVVAGRLAFFTGNKSSSIDDCLINVADTTDLVFQTDANIFVNNIDSVDTVVDILNIGKVTENIEIGTDATISLLIGHEGIPVQISEGTITNYVRTSDIDRNGTNDPVNIGATFASEINLGRSGHNVNIVNGATLMANSIDTTDPAGLFLNTAFITLGEIGGTVQLNSNLAFTASGPTGIDYYTADRQFAIQGSGPFAIQAIGNYSAQRLSSMVTLTIIWSGAPVAVTAPSALSITPVLIAAFRPMTPQTFSCIVRTDGISYTLGFITIGTDGSITIAPVSGTWALLQTVDFGSICCSYDILI